MASLFVLGVMSIVWMAVVAALIAFEKIVPWTRAATWGTAVVLLTLGVLLLAAPDAVHGLTIPGWPMGAGQARPRLSTSAGDVAEVPAARR